MTTTKKKLGLLMGTASMAVLGTLALGAIAYAQDAAPAAAPADDTVVIVTGQRAQLKSAQAIKKNSEVIVDSITAVDIGALPDRSVSEALQRISGLTLMRTNENRDPARLAAEGGGVQIRGLSWVRSETNGRDIFSAKNGRGLSFEDVSADLLAGVDVYKNPSADLIEGGIGGTVNLRTRLPFDQKKRIIAFSVDSNYGDLEKKAHNSYSGVYADRFQTGAGEFGVLLNYSYSDVGNRTDSISTDKRNMVNVAAAGDPADYRYIPGSLGWRQVTWSQHRTALAGALQWRPSDAWLFTLQAMTAKVDAHDLEYALGSYDGSLSTPNASYQYDEDGSLIAGTNPAAGYDADTRYTGNKKETTDIGLNFKYTPQGHFSLSGDLQYVRSFAKVVSMTAYTELADKPSISFAGLNTDSPSITVNEPSSVNDQSRYYWAAAMDHIEDNDGHQASARLDARWDFDDSSWLKYVKVGVRATDKNYTTRQSGYNWSLLSNQYWLGNANTVYITDTVNNPANSTSLQTFDNFFRGDIKVPGNVWFPAADVVSNGTAHAYDLLHQTETAGWGWTPLSDDYSTYKPGSDNQSGGINLQGEKTAAIYAVGRFAGNNLLGWNVEYDGNFGARYVQTEATADNAIFTLPSITTGCPGGAAASPTNCPDIYYGQLFATGTLTAPGTYSHKYSNLLPSFNIRVHLNDQWQLRFAASKAMVRPDLYQMTPYTSLGIAYNTDGTFNTAQTGGAFTGVGGNPYLKPITADQYDLTAEYYFNSTGSFTFDLFEKNLQNYIYTGTTQETYTSGGQTYTFNVSRQLNGFEGTVKGFEVAYQQFYDFLPGALSGLGLQANYTRIKSSGGHNTAVNIFDPNQVTNQDIGSLPLEGMSPESYNLAVMYEKYGISARLAYNYRSTYLLTTSAANINAPVWSEAYGQLDGSVFYTINSQYKIGLQATNIGQARTILDVSTPTDLSIKKRYNWVDTDRRIAVVLRASF
jgi:TonB-dependent receptor